MKFTDGRIKLLVIETTESVRRLMATILEADYDEVLYAVDADEGYHLALTARPDVIITDYRLPHSEERCVCARVRGTPALRTTPVVVTTSWGSSVSELNYFATGCDQLVRKPFRCEELHFAIWKATRMRQQKGKMIQVLFNSGEIDMVDARTLDILVREQGILGFRRRDGMAVIGRDPVRSAPCSRYDGPERRKHVMPPADRPPDGAFLWSRSKATWEAAASRRSE